MKWIVPVAILVPFLIAFCDAQKLKYHDVGCFADKDSPHRALPEYLGHKSPEECALLTNQKGYKAFGMQNGGECWRGPNADKVYNKYGEKSNCKDGLGGKWANDVYIIDGFEQPKCPEKEGRDSKNAIKNCKDFKTKYPEASSRKYWMNPSGREGGAFQGYCDMDTAGGGWTLAYSYTFTNYASFSGGSNAITPQPNWPAVGNIARSTVAPLSETDYAAMDFNLWKTLGSEFMIKSNINHWIKCTEGSGSLINWRAGSISCQIVKNVVSKCPNYVPDQITFVVAGNGGNSLGPDIFRTSSRTRLKEYYYLEASTQTANWPTHDPCGTNGLNHLQGVSNPHGNIYVR